MAVMVGLQLQPELPLASIPNPLKCSRVFCWRRSDVDDVAFAPNPPPPPPKPKRRVLCWRRKKGAVRSDPSAAKPISFDEDEDEDEDEEDRHRHPRIKKMRRQVADSDDDSPNPSSSSSRGGGGGCCKSQSQRQRVSDPSSLTVTATAKTIGRGRSSSRTTAAAEYEYAADIHHNLRSMEVETKMKRWPLAKEMLPIRAALVDWLVAVGERCHLQSDTLFLACSYFDRFLFSNELYPDELQLLSISCLLLAIKYEENRHSLAVPVQDLYSLLIAAATDGYCKEQVLKMETRVVKSLNYQMASPTVKSFVNTFLAAVHLDLDLNLDVDALHVELTHYLAELTLLDHGCNRFLPSLVAASAVFVSRLTSHPETHPWTSTLQRHTGYTPSDLKDCIFAIHDLQTNIKCSTLMAIREKYQIVAMLFPPLPIIPAFPQRDLPLGATLPFLSSCSSLFSYYPYTPPST